MSHPAPSDAGPSRDRLPGCPVRPQIRLSGLIADTRFIDVQRQPDAPLQWDDPIGLERSTTGGDANLAIRIATDLRLLAEHQGREVWSIAKSVVSSAGAPWNASSGPVLPIRRRMKRMGVDAVSDPHGERSIPPVASVDADSVPGATAAMIHDRTLIEAPLRRRSRWLQAEHACRTGPRGRGRPLHCVRRRGRDRRGPVGVARSAVR